MRRRRLLQLSIPALIAPLATGCWRDEAIHIGLHPWPGYEPLLLARHFGWLGESVHLHEGQNAGESIVKLRAGKLAGACLTLDEVLGVRVGGLALTVVLVMDESVGADVVLTRKNIQHLADLKGKRIAFEEGALGSLVLHKTLTAAGLSASDVSLIKLPPNEQLAPWQSGQIDAAISYPPFSAQLEKAGAHRLYDSRQFPHSILDVLAVRTDMLTSHRRAVRSLVTGHLRAMDHLRTSREDGLRRIASWRSTSFEQAEASFRGLHLPGALENRRLLAPEGDVWRTAKNLNTLLHASGYLPAPDPLVGLVSTAFVSTPD